MLVTSQGMLRQVPLLLVNVETEEGVTGRTWLFCYMRSVAPTIMSILGDVKTVAKGAPVDPAAAWAKLTRRVALIGLQGIARMALAVFDTACWDALARAAKQPLVPFLGAELRRITAYNSCGLGLIDDLGALAAEAEKLLAIGNFRAVKLRLDHPTLEFDIEAVKAGRKRVGGKVKLMVDYGQALAVDGALARGCALDKEDIFWLEEPIRHDDYAGAPLLARELKTPGQVG